MGPFRFKGYRIAGQNFGNCRFRRIGSLVATRLQAFGIKLLPMIHTLLMPVLRNLGVEKETLEDLVRESDIITVHTPKTEETFGMIVRNSLKLPKRLRVVNCARGGIINEEALAKAIKEGIVASAGIDVLVDEPKCNSPLLNWKMWVVHPI